MEKIRAIKKIKRLCMVRGCKNRESYSVSCSRELGNSIHICEECAKGIVFAISKNYPADIPVKEETSENVVSEATSEKKPVKSTNKKRKTTNEVGK